MRTSIHHNKRVACHTRFGWTCQVCGWSPPAYLHGQLGVRHRGRYLTVDHVVPVALGGPNLSWNYVTLCNSCNLTKGPRFCRPLLRGGGRCRVHQLGADPARRRRRPELHRGHDADAARPGGPGPGGRSRSRSRPGSSSRRAGGLTRGSLHERDRRVRQRLVQVMGVSDGDHGTPCVSSTPVA